MILAIMSTHNYLAQQQVPFKGYELQIINCYISNVSQYGLFAVILFSLGWIIQKLSPAMEKTAPMMNEQEAFEQTGAFAEEIADSEYYT